MAIRRFRRRSLAEVRAQAEAAVTGRPIEDVRPTRAPRKNVEEQHGIALMQWANHASGRRPELAWLHHIPNGGGRSKAEAGKMKAQGVRKGVLDYFLPVARLCFFNEYCDPFGLYIELKAPQHRNRAQGGMSDDQVRFATFVTAQGFLVCLCYDWHEARAAIEAYLDNEPIPHRWSPPA
jgi:hypothetical protein